MTDDLRWQEVFSGAEENLMNKQNGKVTDVAALKKSYWRTTPADRRLALMPFLWNVIAKRGQIFGNRQLGSDAYVTNGFFFSYPGTTKRFAVPQILASIATIKCHAAWPLPLAQWQVGLPLRVWLRTKEPGRRSSWMAKWRRSSNLRCRKREERVLRSHASKHASKQP
jgi:hypothetical protein